MPSTPLAVSSLQPTPLRVAAVVTSPDGLQRRRRQSLRHSPGSVPPPRPLPRLPQRLPAWRLLPAHLLPAFRHILRFSICLSGSQLPRLSPRPAAPSRAPCGSLRRRLRCRWRPRQTRPPPRPLPSCRLLGRLPAPAPHVTAVMLCLARSTPPITGGAACRRRPHTHPRPPGPAHVASQRLAQSNASRRCKSPLQVCTSNASRRCTPATPQRLIDSPQTPC